MAAPGSVELSEGRVFQFISDPDHKENLSGRVRAACLTCRRKKIKCSGEINCRTCREKGLACEGLSERRKPSRDVGISSPRGTILSGRIERDMKHSQSASRRSSAVLEKSSVVSGHEGRNGEPITAAELPGSAKVGTEMIPPYRPSAAPSCSRRRMAGRPHVDIWRLGRDRIETDSNICETVHRNRSTASNGISLIDNLADPGSHDSWWSGNKDNESGDMTTEKTPEQQPESLRLGTSNDEPASPVRRQTISFPLRTPGSSSEALSDMLHQEHGVFDDISLLPATRTPRSGLTPGLTEFSSLWDISSFDFLAPSSINSGLPLNQVDRQPI